MIDSDTAPQENPLPPPATRRRKTTLAQSGPAARPLPRLRSEQITATLPGDLATEVRRLREVSGMLSLSHILRILIVLGVRQFNPDFRDAYVDGPFGLAPTQRPNGATPPPLAPQLPQLPQPPLPGILYPINPAAVPMPADAYTAPTITNKATPMPSVGFGTVDPYGITPAAPVAYTSASNENDEVDPYG